MIETFKQKTTSLLHNLTSELTSIRTSHPTPALVEHIKVDCYGQMVSIKQVGSISIAPPREILIQVWDTNVIEAALRAIQDSDLHLTPQAQGNVIRIHLPELTQERRDQLAKTVKKIAEQHKIKLRALRDDVNKEIQKKFDGKEIGEDEKFRFKEQIQKYVDEVNSSIDEIVERKVKEINE